MSIRVRHATSGEASAVAALATDLFRQGYAETHPEPELSLYVSRAFSADALERDLTDSRATVLVAEETEKGTLVGYALLREGSLPRSGTPPIAVATEGDGPQNSIEIARFYVDRKWHGSGVAQGLMTACISEAIRRDSDVVWLQAWQKAARPLAFYKKSGFIVVGTTTFEFGSRVDDDFILARGQLKAAAGRSHT